MFCEAEVRSQKGWATFGEKDLLVFSPKGGRSFGGGRGGRTGGSVPSGPSPKRKASFWGEWPFLTPLLRMPLKGRRLFGEGPVGSHLASPILQVVVCDFFGDHFSRVNGDAANNIL